MQTEVSVTIPFIGVSIVYISSILTVSFNRWCHGLCSVIAWWVLKMWDYPARREKRCPSKPNTVQAKRRRRWSYVLISDEDVVLTPSLTPTMEFWRDSVAQIDLKYLFLDFQWRRLIFFSNWPKRYSLPLWPS